VLRKYAILIPALVALMSLSCGVYTFSQSALGGIKSIAIPLFDDQSTEGGLRERLTDQLAQAFVADGTVKVVREQQADGILRGVVVSYSREPYNYTSAEIVTEYICRITLDVQFVNRRSDKVIWEQKGMNNWGTYNADSESEDTGKTRAIDKLVEDIINKTVKGW
jgi:hypothetical protein